MIAEFAWTLLGVIALIALCWYLQAKAERKAKSLCYCREPAHAPHPDDA